MMNKKVDSILFICTGNSCRSIMAEGLLNKMLDEKKMRKIKVYSAGVSAMNGFSPSKDTVTIMKEKGIDVSGYKTAKVAPEMMREADLILVMEKMHKEVLKDLAPEAEGKTHLLKDYTGKNDDAFGSTVPDPIGRPLEIYERVAGMIEISIKELVRRL